MSTGKTFQVYIPGELVDAFQARVDKVAHGNVSGYVQKLHRDEAHATGAEDHRRALVALAELYHPTLARALELQLNHGAKDTPIAQDRAIARFLEALHEALKRSFDPEAPFALYSSEEEFQKLVQRRPEMLRALALVGLELEHHHSLNDPPAKAPRPQKKVSPGSQARRPRTNPAIPPTHAGTASA